MTIHRYMLAMLAVLALAVAGCNRDHDHDHDKDKSGKQDDGHGEGGHAHTGEAHNLGEAAIGPHKMTMTQRGNAPAGGEAVLECVIPMPGGGDVTSVVVWLGKADGEELSPRAKADKHGDGDFDAHIRLPATIPAGALYWVEATLKDGSTHKASWARKE